jgi:MFS family permease
MTKPYTGWLMVPLAALAMVGTMPGRTNFLGVVSQPLIADPAFQLTDRGFSHLNLLAVLLGSVLVLPVGWLIDRLGVRVVLGGVAAALGASVLGMAASESWMMLAGTLVLVRGLGQAALSVVALTLVGKWFSRRLGPAMGLFMVLITVGFIAGSLWLVASVQANGWREPWRHLGNMLFGLAALGLLLARNGPDTPADDPPPTVRVGDALRTRAFWAPTLCGALLLLTLAAVTLFQRQLLLAHGFPADGVSDAFKAVLGTMTFAGLPANLVGGYLVRRVSRGKVLGTGMGLLAASLGLFPWVTTLPLAVAWAALLGVAGGLVSVAYLSAYGGSFGRGRLGGIQTVAQVVTVFGSAVGPELLTAGGESVGRSDGFFYAAAVAAVGLAAYSWGVSDRGG